MARLARLTLSGYPHQVTQRGNYGQRVFEADADFERYLGWTREYADRYSVEIWAYCLMPNHVHFLCMPKVDGGLALCFNTLNMRYAQYFHKKKGVTGHLWRGRFLSCMLDDQSVTEEIRYIENNPVRAGIVERAEDFPWSSAQDHLGSGPSPSLIEDCFVTNEIPDWRNYLTQAGDQRILDRTRRCLKTGRPAGEVEFVKNLEWILGRRLQALPVGRPKKSPGLNREHQRIG